MDATTIAVSAELRNDVLTLLSLVITGLVGLGVTWMKQHFNKQGDVAMNLAIERVSSRLAPDLITELDKAGESVKTVNVYSPALRAVGQVVMDRYPGFAKDMGLTPEKAANFVLEEAKKLVVQKAAVPPEPAPDPAPPPALLPSDAPQVKPEASKGSPTAGPVPAAPTPASAVGGTPTLVTALTNSP